MADFSIKPNQLANIARKLQKIPGNSEKTLAGIMNSAMTVAYRTAHARRPKVPAKRGYKGYRVSDPNAAYGVPVKTGALQASIQLTKAVPGPKMTAKVESRGIEYAKFIEYGTSRMRARPFMRPAQYKMEAALKRLIGKFRSKIRS